MKYFYIAVSKYHTKQYIIAFVLFSPFSFRLSRQRPAIQEAAQVCAILLQSDQIFANFTKMEKRYWNLQPVITVTKNFMANQTGNNKAIHHQLWAPGGNGAPGLRALSPAEKEPKKGFVIFSTILQIFVQLSSTYLLKHPSDISSNILPIFMQISYFTESDFQ